MAPTSVPHTVSSGGSGGAAHVSSTEDAWLAWFREGRAALQNDLERQFEAAAPAAPAAARTDASVVRVTPEMARNFKVASLAIETLDSSQEITGRIEANDQWVTRIGASVTGRVTEVFARVRPPPRILPPLKRRRRG